MRLVHLSRVLIYGAIAEVIHILKKVQENLVKCEALKNLHYSCVEHKGALLLAAQKKNQNIQDGTKEVQIIFFTYKKTLKQTSPKQDPYLCWAHGGSLEGFTGATLMFVSLIWKPGVWMLEWQVQSMIPVIGSADAIMVYLFKEKSVGN